MEQRVFLNLEGKLKRYTNLMHQFHNIKWDKLPLLVILKPLNAMSPIVSVIRIVIITKVVINNFIVWVAVPYCNSGLAILT
jgi:hypothetical protein